MAEIEAATVVNGDVRREQFGLISKLLLTYPISNATAETGKARGEAYLEAISDITPSVMAEAIRRWHRGEAGEHNYHWAPSPAALRMVCLSLMEPSKVAAKDLQDLLGAVSLERAMDPTPLESEKKVGILQRIA